MGQGLVLGFPNVFGMTGMFVFPGLLGHAFHLPAEQIADLAGMSFATCGILQSVLLRAGGFSAIVYPDNIGIIRIRRVAARDATMAAGVLLIVLGGCGKFDMLLVAVPVPVLLASAPLLFGIVFMQGVRMLVKVDWNDRAFIAAGLALRIGISGLFVKRCSARHGPGHGPPQDDRYAMRADRWI